MLGNDRYEKLAELVSILVRRTEQNNISWTRRSSGTGMLKDNVFSTSTTHSTITVSFGDVGPPRLRIANANGETVQEATVLDRLVFPLSNELEKLIALLRERYPDPTEFIDRVIDDLRESG